MSQEVTPEAVDNLLPEVAELIVAALNLEVAAAEIEPDAPLFGEGLGLDSIDALELVVAIEREFAIAIPEGKVDHDVFHSVRTLAVWLAERLPQGDPSDSSQPSQQSVRRSARSRAPAS